MNQTQDEFITPWIAFDLDGTIAFYDRWRGPEHIGKPIQPMIELLLQYLAQGFKIKIFTARASIPKQIPYIKKWLKENNLPDLEITNRKDFGMIMLYDDKCLQVETNTGILMKNESAITT